MLLKVKDFLWVRDYYKIAIVIICSNTLFELVFQYRFQTKIEVVYFLAAAVISVVMVKNLIRRHGNDYLPVFYCFWPTIALLISIISACKFSLFPFIVSSFVMIFCGKFKKKLIKIVVVVINSIILIMYLSFCFLLYWIGPTIEVLEIVYSPDNKYVMVLEETEVFPAGGDVSVYLGRNINFGILGGYMPRKAKFRGPCGEYVAIHFIDDDFISINGEVIEL